MGATGSSVDSQGCGGTNLRRTCFLSVRRSQAEAFPEPHPMAAELAERKRAESSARPRYKRLAADAVASVPPAVTQQIRIDVPRTFSALPSGRRGFWGWEPAACSGPAVAEAEAAALKVREATLLSVLLSHEWRAMDMKRDGERDERQSSTYVQGINLLAAMCLGFVGGREEDCFWLLLHLTEDVLSRGFFACSPPLLRYHGDKTATANLVATEAPRLTRLLGPQRLAEAVSMLAARCFLSGFVGCLAPGPLLSLWEELLGMRQSSTPCASYPRFPLLEHLVGLIVLAQEALMEIARENSGPEIGPLFFKHVQKVGRDLRDDWRPGLNIPAHRIAELRAISDEASQQYGHIHEEQQVRESWAKNVNQSLERSSTSLLNAMKSATNLTQAAPR